MDDEGLTWHNSFRCPQCSKLYNGKKCEECGYVPTSINIDISRKPVKKDFKTCKRCGIPNTRPNIIFNEVGVCQACINSDKMKKVDWEKRKKELFKICEKHINLDNRYDVVIPVSGGKDSHALVYFLKEELGMTPLLVTVADAFEMTEAGKRNLLNIRKTFNCDHFVYNFGTETFRKATRIGFEKFGNPLLFIEIAIKTVPFQVMVNRGIPLMFYGEDAGYMYGFRDSERKYATDWILGIFDEYEKELLSVFESNGIDKDMMNCMWKPNEDKIKRLKPEVYWMSYFIYWDCMNNQKIARRYGFRDLYHYWQREGYYDHYQQIDSFGYMVHHWLKYPKFGFNRPLDKAAVDVREGRITLEQARELSKDHWMIDQRAIDDFCGFCGYTNREFWDIVERFWNRDIEEYHYHKDYLHVKMPEIRSTYE